MWIMVALGALIGAGMGGPFGAIVGAGIGWWLFERLRRSAVGRLGAALGNVRQLQAQFLESTFAVMGALCKADGHVTPDEIRVAEALFDKLMLRGEQREAAKAAFRRGKEPGFDVEGEVARFARVVHGNRALYQIFIQVQLSAIAADGQLHPAEHDMLVRIARALGMSEAEVAQLEAMLGVGGGAGAGAGGRPSTADELAAAYALLGVDADASDALVKRAYRRQMSENHPDKLAAKGLPESMRAMANEKTARISNAYERIKAARGMA